MNECRKPHAEQARDEAGENVPGCLCVIWRGSRCSAKLCPFAERAQGGWDPIRISGVYRGRSKGCRGVTVAVVVTSLGGLSLRRSRVDLRACISARRTPRRSVPFGRHGFRLGGSSRTTSRLTLFTSCGDGSAGTRELHLLVRKLTRFPRGAADCVSHAAAFFSRLLTFNLSLDLAPNPIDSIPFRLTPNKKMLIAFRSSQNVIIVVR